MKRAAVGTVAGRLCEDESCAGGGCAGADGFCVGGVCAGDFCAGGFCAGGLRKGVSVVDGFCAGGFCSGAFCAGTHCADAGGVGEDVTGVVAGEGGDAGCMEHMWFTHSCVVCNTASEILLQSQTKQGVCIIPADHCPAGQWSAGTTALKISTLKVNTCIQLVVL